MNIDTTTTGLMLQEIATAVQAGSGDGIVRVFDSSDNILLDTTITDAGTISGNKLTFSSIVQSNALLIGQTSYLEVYDSDMNLIFRNSLSGYNFYTNRPINITSISYSLPAVQTPTDLYPETSKWPSSYSITLPTLPSTFLDISFYIANSGLGSTKTNLDYPDHYAYHIEPAVNNIHHCHFNTLYLSGSTFSLTFDTTDPDFDNSTFFGYLDITAANQTDVWGSTLSPYDLVGTRSRYGEVDSAIVFDVVQNNAQSYFYNIAPNLSAASNRRIWRFTL